MNKFKNTSLILIGMIPLLRATNRLYYAVWVSLCFLAVMFLSALISWGISKLICGKIALFLDLLAAAGISVSVSLLLSAYVPAAASGIGDCLAFLAVNVVLIRLSEAFAEGYEKAYVKNAVLAALGGAILLIAVAAVRELLVYGTLFSKFGGSEGIRVFSDWFDTVEFAETSAGALMIFAVSAAVFQKAAEKIRILYRNSRLRFERIVSGNHPELVKDDVTGKIIRRSTAEVLNRQRKVNETNADNSDADAEEQEGDR